MTGGPGACHNERRGHAERESAANRQAGLPALPGSREAEVGQVKAIPLKPNPRIDLIDALRGSALMGIFLLHSIGHWSFARYPANPPAWLQVLNTRTQDLGLFLFEGKAYGIFAMMFGVSFFLILDRWSRRGISFRGRFLWRLAVLAVFGYLNAIIYCGDILLPIAVLAVPLVFLTRLGNRALAWIAAALLLQIPSLWEAGRALADPGYQPLPPPTREIYGQLFDVFSQGSFLDVSAINAGKGQMARIWWMIESGRAMQMMGLFVCGLMLGRSRILEDRVRSLRLARQVLWSGLIGFAILYSLRFQWAEWGLNGRGLSLVANLVSSYRSLAQIAVWIGVFVLLHHGARSGRALNLLAPYGRMSLTGYVAQGMIGVPLFYSYGLALHRHLGPFTSLLLGAALFAVHCAGAHLWLKRFNYGPLEWLWRSCTFLNFTTPMRKAGRIR